MGGRPVPSRRTLAVGPARVTGSVQGVWTGDGSERGSEGKKQGPHCPPQVPLVPLRPRDPVGDGRNGVLVSVVGTVPVSTDTPLRHQVLNRKEEFVQERRTKSLCLRGSPRYSFHSHSRRPTTTAVCGLGPRDIVTKDVIRKGSGPLWRPSEDRVKTRLWSGRTDPLEPIP